MKFNHSIIVAVTGGMGCGQTTVCQFLEKMGAKSLNADNIARKEIENNEFIRKELSRAFGNKIFFRNGKLNRKLLAHIAFSDEAKTTHLNRTVHPQMVSRIITLIEEIRESGKYGIILVDAALIYELSLEHMFDAVIVVVSAMKNRLERIMKRDQLSEKEITDRMNKQIPVEEKMRWGDFVIENDGELELLEKNCKKLYADLLKIHKKRSHIPQNKRARS